MATTQVVRDTKAQVVARAADSGGGQPTVFDLIRQRKGAIEQALPKHLDTDRFGRIAMTLVRTNPKLAACDPMSFVGALMISAQLGLEPSGPGGLGQAWLVPYGREVQFQIGYKGIIELARRSGKLLSIEAHEVCENDEFSYSYGLDDHLSHTPVLRGERGATYAYYAVAKFKDGGHAFVVLSRDDVEKHRKRSKAAGSGPWVTDYDAMARKTCIRVLAPYLPLSPELEKAIGGDGQVYKRIEPDMADASPGDGMPPVDDDEPVEGEIVVEPEPGSFS